MLLLLLLLILPPLEVVLFHSAPCLCSVPVVFAIIRSNSLGNEAAATSSASLATRAFISMLVESGGGWMMARVEGSSSASENHPPNDGFITQPTALRTKILGTKDPMDLRAAD